MEHFANWGGIVPCSAEVLCSYLAAYAGSLAVSTLKRRIAAISVAHDSLGLDNPTNSKLVKATLRGIQRSHGACQRQVNPLLVEDLINVVSIMGDKPKDVRDTALLMLGFAGGFRRSELVDLDRCALKFVQQGLVVNIRRSKTDQVGEGREVGIPIARGRFCPVKTLETWLELSEIKEGPIFRPVNKHGHIEDKRLSKEAVAVIVKARVQAIGLDPEGYSGHSLRAGLATSAAMRGVSALAIRQQTGHRSDATLAKYVRSGELFLNNAVSSLL